jgi:hypothetical protein
MEVDPLSPTASRLSSRSASEERNVLLQDKQLKLRDNREKEIYKKLKDRNSSSLLPLIQPYFQAIGMDSEFDLVFKNIGWEDAWDINEQGCKLLTIEFLYTLQTTNSEDSFRFFGKEFSIP